MVGSAGPPHVIEKRSNRGIRYGQHGPLGNRSVGHPGKHATEDAFYPESVFQLPIGDLRIRIHTLLLPCGRILFEDRPSGPSPQRRLRRAQKELRYVHPGPTGYGRAAAPEGRVRKTGIGQSDKIVPDRRPPDHLLEKTLRGEPHRGRIHDVDASLSTHRRQVSAVFGGLRPAKGIDFIDPRSVHADDIVIGGRNSIDAQVVLQESDDIAHP